MCRVGGERAVVCSGWEKGGCMVRVGKERLYGPGGERAVVCSGWGKSGCMVRVGIFLDFVRLTTRTMHPHWGVRAGSQTKTKWPQSGWH